MTGSGELLLPSVGWRRIGIISHMAYWILVRYDKTHFGVKMYSVICLNREKEQLQFHRVTAHWRLTSQPCEVSGPRLSLQRHSVSHWDCRPAGFSGFKENGMAQSRRPWTCKCSSFGSPQNSWYFSKPLPPSVKWQAYEFFFQRPTEENTFAYLSVWECSRLLSHEAPGAMCQAGAKDLSTTSSLPVPRSWACLLPFPVCQHSLFHMGSCSLHLCLHLPES